MSSGNNCLNADWIQNVTIVWRLYEGKERALLYYMHYKSSKKKFENKRGQYTKIFIKSQRCRTDIFSPGQNCISEGPHMLDSPNLYNSVVLAFQQEIISSYSNYVVARGGAVV